MDPFVFAVVLAAAGMHAGWNALVKARLEPVLGITLVVAACGVIALPMLIVFGVARPAAFPNIAASLVLHLLYYLALAAAYRLGEMSLVYPLARGGGPLFATLIVLMLGERIGSHTLLGVVVLGGGILLMSLYKLHARTRADFAAIGFALLTGAIIAGYTVVDGLGARRAGDAGAYAATLFVLDALPLPLLLLWRRGLGVLRPIRGYWRQGLLGGAMSLASYWIAIWAMTVAPIPAVAALRETSVLFSAVIATLLLKERFVAMRGAAAVVILAGIFIIRLG